MNFRFFFVFVSVVGLACSGGSQSVGDNDPSGSGQAERQDEPNGVDAGTSGARKGDRTEIPPGAKRVFATSVGYSADLGGIAGADAKCATSAKSALLEGTWKAWISDSKTDAIDRIEDVGPWYRLDGAKVLNNKAGLETQPLLPINVDENILSFSFGDARGYAWTGTKRGSKVTATCEDWREGGAYTGGASNPFLEEVAGVGCGEELRLLCLEQ